MAEVTTLFWDNGGVILTNGWDRGSRQKAVEKFVLDWADFEDRHELMLHAFECGEATLDEYIQRTVFYRDRAFTPQQFKQFMFEQSQSLPEALAFAKKLAATKRQLNAALNNESREINDYRIKTFGLRDCFEAFFSSCYLGVRKPDRGIFSLALKITQRDPAECVMIDDRGLNLECAREMGMKTILVKDLPQLRADLAKLGVTAD
ncbi:MAG: HAD-IA family hydrolase [Candidatus Acidiferrales bacterium]